MSKESITWGDLKKFAEKKQIPDEALIRFNPGYMEYCYGAIHDAGLVILAQYNEQELLLSDVDLR